MNRKRLTLQDASLAVARLMPHLMRGVQLEFFVKRGVTQTQFLMMASIHASTRCGMGTLARNFNVSMPTVTGIVDRLVRARLVRRVPQAQDRRQVAVELTAEGQRFFRDFELIIRRRWEQALQALDTRELRTFHEVMTKLTARLQPAGTSRERR